MLPMKSRFLFTDNAAAPFTFPFRRKYISPPREPEQISSPQILVCGFHDLHGASLEIIAACSLPQDTKSTPFIFLHLDLSSFHWAGKNQNYREASSNVCKMNRQVTGARGINKLRVFLMQASLHPYRANKPSTLG